MFEGYSDTVVKGVSNGALRREEEARRRARGWRNGYAVLARTPFYVEAGDRSPTRDGCTAAPAIARVGGTTARPPRAHRVEKVEGRLAVRDLVTAEVDCAMRDATRRNHTATHLFAAALRKVLGSHVKQAGLLVAPDRLRFDFVHFSGHAEQRLDQIERMVNGHRQE